MQDSTDIANTLGRVRFLQVGEEFANIAQVAHRGGAHCPGDTCCGSKQVGENRDFVTDGVFEEKCWTVPTEHEVTDRCHFEPRRYWVADADEVSITFERSDKVAQIPIFHTV